MFTIINVSVVQLLMHIIIHIVVLIKLPMPLYVFQTIEFFIIEVPVGRNNDVAQVLPVGITLSALKLSSGGLYRITTRGKSIRTDEKVTHHA